MQFLEEVGVNKIANDNPQLMQLYELSGQMEEFFPSIVGLLLIKTSWLNASKPRNM